MVMSWEYFRRHRNLHPEEGLMAPEAGVGMIALRAKATVIPVALVDTEKLYPPHSLFFRFHRINIVYGRPVPLDDLYYGQGGREAGDEVGLRITAAIEALLKEHRQP